MKISKIARFALLSTLAFAPFTTGCSAATENAGASESDEALSVSTLPPPADPKARLYFGDPAYDFHTDDAPLSYRVFSAEGGNEIKVGAAAMDAQNNIDVTASVGFKLYRLGRVHGKTQWILVTSVDGVNGVATLRYQRNAAATYMMEVTGGPLPLTTRSDLECSGGDNSACETARQPGESCGGIADAQFQCDQGLFCVYATGVCGDGDQQGSCAAKPGICPLFVSYVCGCDGLTYGNDCEAHRAGTSVAYAGKCN